MQRWGVVLKAEGARKEDYISTPPHPTHPTPPHPRFDCDGELCTVAWLRDGVLLLMDSAYHLRALDSSLNEIETITIEPLALTAMGAQQASRHSNAICSDSSALFALGSAGVHRISARGLDDWLSQAPAAAAISPHSSLSAAMPILYLCLY